MSECVDVFCVYGDDNVDHISNVLLPSLRRATTRSVRFWTINYSAVGRRSLASANPGDSSSIVELPNKNKSIGFAEGHNMIFAARGGVDDFIIINPDCVFSEFSIDILYARKAADRECAIVEARQWPWEHPKEYDDLTGETPWASGAAQLIDGRFYKEVGGMDENYFLYLEDVDLSWRAWLTGRRVVYEHSAAVAHFTGGSFYRSDLISKEQYFGLRNFIYLSKKFFGEEGEARALQMLILHPDQELVKSVVHDYWSSMRDSVPVLSPLVHHPQVKIFGVNQFHLLR